MQIGSIHIKGALTCILPLQGGLALALSDRPSLLLRPKIPWVATVEWFVRKYWPEGSSIHLRTPTSGLPFWIEAVHWGGALPTKDLVVVQSEDGPMENTPPPSSPKKLQPFHIVTIA